MKKDSVLHITQLVLSVGVDPGRHHFAQYYTRKRKKKTIAHSVEEGRDLFLGIVSVDTCSVQNSLWTKKLTINNVPVTFKLKTGAQANIIPTFVEKQPTINHV